MLQAVARPPPSDDAIAAAQDRRRRLLEALAAGHLTQSELHRRLVEAGERELAFTTVNAWCTGRAALRHLTLLGIFAVLGLPADWDGGPPAPARKRR